MVKNVLVLGYFGYITNQIDGQTVRTRSIYGLLEKYSGKNISFFDTQCFRISKIKFVYFVYLLFKFDAVVCVAAQRNLKFLFPLIYIITRMTGAKLHYVAVGGWLFEYLKELPLHRFMLSRSEGVYVQTQDLHRNLKLCGFCNVKVLNNFRMVDYPDIDPLPSAPVEKKLVFMARVHPMKGVDVLFDLEKRLLDEGFFDVEIDIYGPIFKDYEKAFFEKIEKSSIRYRGILDPSEIYGVLKDYSLMLFPTRYYTEGFPGTILDAYIAGVPVVATRWLNADEFVGNEVTGLLVDFDNSQEFVDKVMLLINDPNGLLRLKRNVMAKRDAYSPKQAWDTLKDAFC